MSYFDLIQKTIQSRWSKERAWQWHNDRPWRMGCNFVPSTAINQLEMWQAETFDPTAIDRELGWLANLGMNSMRVFLHDLLWSDDRDGFLSRIDQYLSIADKHGITTLFVFFDSCWFPFPHLGKQRDPEPGVHNSYWVQSPGVTALRDPTAFAQLESYVTGTVNHFRNDPRVEGWDIWNEPDNGNTGAYGSSDLGAQKVEIVFPLLVQAFEWIRMVQPSQPVTSAVWQVQDRMPVSPLENFQLEASDVISFHRYAGLQETASTVDLLQKEFDRPLLCTEFMARPVGSTFRDVLPLFHKDRINAYCWGSIAGKSQTIYPWNSWQKPSPSEPPLWFHDVLRSDGTPYLQDETDMLRKINNERM